MYKNKGGNLSAPGKIHEVAMNSTRQNSSMLNKFWKALKRDITLKDIKRIETNLPSSIPYIGPIYAGVLQDLAVEFNAEEGHSCR